MNYKVETKNSIWQVILSRGSYSDYEETHLFFAGNSEEEIKIFLKQFILESGTKDKYGNFSVPALGFYGRDLSGIAFEDGEFWTDKIITGDNQVSDPHDDPVWGNYSQDNIWDCKIKKLSVIYVNSIKNNETKAN